LLPRSTPRPFDRVKRLSVCDIRPARLVPPAESRSELDRNQLNNDKIMPDIATITINPSRGEAFVLMRFD
jgi:hypothetical protein